MVFRLSGLIVLFIALQNPLAAGDPADVETRVLKNRLDNLESQAVQRRDREPTVLDLLRRQDDRLAGQALNTLKTKRPRSTAVPLLERQLFRSRRPAGRFDPR